MINRLLKATALLAVISVCISCNQSSGNKWSRMVPAQTSFIIVPAPNASVQTILHSRYAPFLESLSASAFQWVAKIDSNAAHSLPVKSVLLYPGTGPKLQPVWITRGSKKFIHKLSKKYHHPFTQNKYSFHGVSILNLQFNERHIFATKLGNYVLISASSLALENTIRSFKDLQPRADLKNRAKNTHPLIMNTPGLERWLSHIARVKYHPLIKNAFKGTGAAPLMVSLLGDSSRYHIQLSGKIPLNDKSHSPLFQNLGFKNEAVSLDQYISSDAAAFGVFRVPPVAKFSGPLPDTTQTDAYLMHHPDVYQHIATNLESKLALEMFSQSGTLSKAEHLFIRKLKRPQVLRQQLDNFPEDMVKKMDSTYFVQSRAMGQLLGSQFCHFKNFYLSLTGNTAVIAKRKGLAKRVDADRSERQIITYEPYYKKIKSKLPSSVSGLFITGKGFDSYLQSLLTANSDAAHFISSFNHIAIATRIDEEGQNISLHINTFKNPAENQAYRSRWIYKDPGINLTGKPVAGNITDGFNNEIAIATKSGTIDVLSSDGNLIRQMKTGGNQPIGSPVIYDWYGTGQNVILVAAGNKIYGWDKNGDLLPRFPFTMKEKITAPLRIADINHNKLPNAVVSTADRKVHVLNGRGEDITGWPVKTNAAVKTLPLVDYYHGKSSIVVFASNAVHGWDASGTPLPGFPHFINAELRGSPAKYKHTILGGAVDGKLYTVGGQPHFDSNPSSNNQNNAVDLSNSPLYGKPVVTGNQILTASANGSIFLLNAKGQLQLTKNMGQAAATNWSPVITDINANGKQDIISLSKFGRLFAWQLANGQRLKDFPQKAMYQAAIKDLDGDGLMEIIAQTDEGIQCWTINRS